MFANRTYKLIMIALFSVIVFEQTRSISISQIGDVRIEVSDDKWLCDKLECPRNTYRCYVAKHKDPHDPTTLVRTNICYSKHNHVLSKSVTTQKVDRNASIKMHLNSYRSGVISSIDSYSTNDAVNFDGNKFNQDLNNDLQNMSKDMVREMSNMNRNIQNEMQHLNVDLLSKITHNLSHIFD